MLKKPDSAKSNFIYALLLVAGIASIGWVSNEAITNPDFEGLIEISVTNKGAEVIIDRRPHVEKEP